MNSSLLAITLHFSVITTLGYSDTQYSVPCNDVLNGVWWSKNITRNRKKMIYNSMVKSVLIYGAEIWSLYEDDRRRINATEMDTLTLRLPD